MGQAPRRWEQADSLYGRDQSVADQRTGRTVAGKPAARRRPTAGRFSTDELASSLTPGAAARQKTIRQYFDHQYDEALAVYDDIRERLGTGPHQEVDDARLFATCSRNGAECLLDPALRPIDGAIRDRLEQMLNAGRDVAEESGLGEVAADIDYTLARIAEAAGDEAAATSILVGLVTDEAKEGYPLLAAISAMRLFWSGIAHGRAAFAWDRFDRLVRALDLFDHAWAVRVAIRARLRATNALFLRGAADDPARARALVKENIAAINRNHGLLSHDDTRDAALTAAAGDILAVEDSQRWPQFAAGPRVAMLPYGWARKTAAEIWEEAS